MVDLQAVYKAGGSVPSSMEPTRVRTEFPETWLWSESIAGYHLTTTFVCAAKFESLSWCICLQNYLRSFAAVWWQFVTKGPTILGPLLRWIVFPDWLLLFLHVFVCADLCRNAEIMNDDDYFYFEMDSDDSSSLDSVATIARSLKMLTRLRTEFRETVCRVISYVSDDTCCRLHSEVSVIDMVKFPPKLCPIVRCRLTTVVDPERL